MFYVIVKWLIWLKISCKFTYILLSDVVVISMGYKGVDNEMVKCG